ncbi:MAG: PD-(D/E)XK nuclease family protein [Pseudomonadales bacterium]|nr:PD-(D/E)XK nuclease family protein [Pseudomonadales bacterium]
MSEIISDTEELYRRLAQGALVLTPNHRRSIQLLEDYGAHLRQHARPLVCPSPAVFPVDIWIRHCWEHLQSSGRGIPGSQGVLEPLQELLLWQLIISESDSGALLFNQDATARKVQEAATLLQQWGIPRAELNSPASLNPSHADLKVFLPWLERFEKLCTDKQVQTLSSLVKAVTAALSGDLVKLPTDIILSGFDKPPPLYQAFFESLHRPAHRVSVFHYPRHAPLIKKAVLNDEKEEVIAAAKWAQTILETEPDAKIAVICADLDSRAREVRRIFTRFMPSSENAVLTRGEQRFTVSATEPLRRVALISTALAILNLNRPVVPVLDFFRLLRSPFIKAAGTEEDARASLEFHLRDKGELESSLANLRFLMQTQGKAYHCPELGNALQAMEALKLRHKSARSCHDWVVFIEAQLGAMGWPGADALAAGDLRLRRDWQLVLTEFQKLGHLLGKIQLDAALSCLQHLALHMHPGTKVPSASVNILTSAEAEGLRFTHRWIMGLSERSWPPAISPNPFIPLALQQRYQIPAADNKALLAQSWDTLQAFIADTRVQCVLSHACHHEESRVRAASVFERIAGIEDTALTQDIQTALHPAARLLLGHGSSESFRDELCIPLLRTETIRGGTSLIADQAACPFKSFAVHRLLAKEFPRPSYGLSAKASGSLLHHALELLWRELQEQDHLLQASAQDLRQVIYQASINAVKKTSRDFPQTMSKRFCELEVSRLEQVLDQWLQQERKRSSFRIAELEQHVQWQFAGLTLNFRIDRIDQLPDGRTVLVDYKSSTNNAVNWQDQRQHKPQLLLYLLAAEQSGRFDKLAAILYAQVNIENAKFMGVVTDEALVAGLSRDRQSLVVDTGQWQDLKHLWQDSLQGLAQEFLDGYAAITPKSQASCQYCHLGAFCRIRESMSLEEVPIP